MSLFMFYIHIAQGEIMGDFEEVPDSECEDLFYIIMDKLDPTFFNHKISFCEKKLVHGYNYKMILVNDDHHIPSCDLIVWHNFNKNEYKVLKRKAKYMDCYKELTKYHDKQRESEVDADM